MITSNLDNQDSIETKLEAFRIKCKSAGLKVTPQRVAVYKVLAQSCEHPSAEAVCREVHKDMPNVSLDTVNRTLLTLSEIGAAFTVEGTGDAKRYDANLEDHQHFKCLKCKKIIDIFDKDFGVIETPAVLTDTLIMRKTVYFEGLCSSCTEEN